jgi:N-acetylglucosaminyl-diphospho-decaprenol L-rhamnosyltransferase
VPAEPDAFDVNAAISVVSHGHGQKVMRLLNDLSAMAANDVCEILLTLNIPEPELCIDVKNRPWPFQIKIIENDRATGFGANHNAAFSRCSPLDFFCVLNPDVSLTENPFPELFKGLAVPHAGCAFPLQVDHDGRVQKSAREVPSLRALLRRYFGSQRSSCGNEAVHWVTGACMLFNSDVYRKLGGFDERYFMYCEDVDLCLRMQLAGFALVSAEARVVHVAYGASHRDARHLLWHLRSLIRLWRSDSYRAFLKVPGTKC